MCCSPAWPRTSASTPARTSPGISISNSRKVLKPCNDREFQIVLSYTYMPQCTLSQSSPRCLSEGMLVMGAPKVRKHLSADALFGVLHTGFAAIADHRPGTPDIALRDVFMSAFALFSLKSPALL